MFEHFDRNSYLTRGLEIFFRCLELIEGLLYSLQTRHGRLCSGIFVRDREFIDASIIVRGKNVTSMFYLIRVWCSRSSGISFHGG
jgi:hypothetical protein